MLWAMHFDRSCDVEQDRSAGSQDKGDFPQMTRACLALRMTACILVEFERYPHSWRLVLVYNNEPYAAHSSSTRRLLVDYSDIWLVSIWEPTSLCGSHQSFSLMASFLFTCTMVGGTWATL